MDLQTLCGVLQACMIPDAAQRTAAEAALKQHESTPGQATNLLRVAAEAAVDPAVRQSATIYFKNLVKRTWDPPEAPANAASFRLSPEEKNVIKENLLETLIRAPHAIQVQLGEVLKTAVYADFPEQWPGLLPALTANLQSQDAVRVHGALYALRIVTRKYEFRDEEERGPLAPLIATTFPPLLHILQQLVASPQTPENCTYTKLVCKTFWSATYMGIPDFLIEPTNFQNWMHILLTMVRQDLPEDQQAPRKEDRPSSPWWKSRKWLFHILYRFVSRYAHPKHCKEGNDQKFAEVFQRECCIPFLDAVLGKVAALAAGQYASPRVVNLTFQYLSVALGYADMYKHVGAHWDSILANVAFPLMCFTDEDAELWRDDPHEYIRKGYDILEDMYSPKTAVANFAHDLCKKKKAHLDKFLQAMVAILQQYHTAAAAQGGHADPALVRRMDGALLVIGVLSDLLKNKKPYKHQLGGMLVNFVVPLFTCPYGHLRAKAVWVAGTYADVKYPDGQGSGPTFTMLFEKAVSLLADPDLPVRVDTVIALRLFIDAAEDTESLKPVLPTLLNHIFHLMNELDVEDIVFSLESLVEKFGQDIAPYAVQMVTQLAAAFDRYTNQADEEEEDDDDASGLAAYGCMRAINTLLESVSGLGPELFPTLEKALLPMMYKLLSADGHEVMEEVLEMLGYFTFCGNGISPDLWKLWPRMHAVLMEFGIDYWESLLLPLDNMICRDTNTFLNSQDPNYQQSAYQMIEYSLAGDFGDREVVHAAYLAEVIMQACRGRVDHWIGPYINLALQRFAKSENKKLKDALVNMVANALYYNTPLALQVLQQANAVDSFFHHWFSMIMASKPSGKMPHFKRLHDKKVCLLGLISVLQLPLESVPPGVLQTGQAHLLAGITRVLQAFQKQEEEMKAAAEEEDEDDEEEDDDADANGVDEDGGEGDWDGDEEEDDDYLKNLSKRAKELLGEGDEDDSDDDWTDDELVETPIDNVEPFILFSDTVTQLAATQPAKHAQLMAAVQGSADATAALTAIMQHAVVKREEKAKEAARLAQ